MKRCNDKHQPVLNNNKNRKKRGTSSFNMHDSMLVFEKMNLKKGDIFVDLGCGAGEYSLHAAGIVGAQGKVYAVDVYRETLDMLNEEAAGLELNNLETIENDICNAIELKDNSADICLISTVMHAHKVSEKCKNLFPEIVRILKPDRQLSIIECKKEERPFGPPLHMRISPEELEKGVSPYGFEKTSYVDLGYNYMMLFSLTGKNDKSKQ